MKLIGVASNGLGPGEYQAVSYRRYSAEPRQFSILIEEMDGDRAQVTLTAPDATYVADGFDAVHRSSSPVTIQFTLAGEICRIIEGQTILFERPTSWELVGNLEVVD